MNELRLTEKQFDLFKNFVYKESGICFNVINKIILESRIASAMKEKKLDNVEDYYRIVSSDREELNKFLDNITTNLTKFFRNEPNFRLLKNYVLPRIMKNKKSGEKIRIWSAGCSTGEEPYSIAITCLETPGIKEADIKIFASDLSLNSLIAAKEGRYEVQKVENVPKEYLYKYFDELSSGEYVVKNYIKKLITFDYHNLIHRGSQTNMDVIFCRNVLIYFDNESVKLTVNRFYDILNEHGFLFIGHSESLFGLNTKFKFNNIDNSIVYTKN
ncbi:protein-glutamate O-methyltransferase CheR [uncultured Brachyspira sp.]|uniref:CheR family methyltransferase n=1 Tax=uncultured Brachyspira sp. TaxID=221953 RepID=UPI0025DC2C1E|nr:protein-glutamate O-methyltransferase CheR [uncultured Brachyspira sp.]